jgi:serine/threonine-protein kinase
VDGLFEQTVAVKLIRPGLLGVIAAARFAEERRLLAKLDHPAIARIIDGGVSPAGDWPYLVMDFVDGEPIDLWLQTRPIGVGERITLLMQAIDAVQAAHARFIAHADIKPENLLVTAEGRVRLVDFGIAQLLDGQAYDALRPMTQGYASPERIAGGAPGVADDIYALGTLLDHIVPAAERDPDLAAITRRARAALPGDRYASADQLRADLQRWRERKPVAARVATSRYRLERFFARHRSAILATIAGLLLLVAVAAVAIVNRADARREEAAKAQRVRDLLGVTHYLLFDLDERMARQPQSLALRAAIVGRAQAYLDRLGALPDADAATRLQAAAGLQRLAAEQDYPARANLGQPQAAWRSLNRAVGLIQNLPGTAPSLAIAGLRLDQARIALFADGDLPAAVRALADARRRLAAAGPAAKADAGPYLLLVAQLRGWQGRYADEIGSARRAGAATAPSDPRDAALFAARVADATGDGLFYSGDLAASEAAYRDERAILTRAARRWPDDPSLKQAVARSAWALGSTMLERGHAAEAFDLLSQGDREIRALTEFDTRDDEAARMRNIIDDARAQALAQAGNAPDAMRLLDAGVARWRAMWRAAPNPIRLRDYAIALQTAGAMRADHGDPHSACTDYRAADRLFASDARRLTPFDVQTTLTSIRAGEAKNCGRTG